MTWALVIVAGWLLLGVLIGVLIGRSVRLADMRAAHDDLNFVVDPAAALYELPAPPLPFRVANGDIAQPQPQRPRQAPRATPTIPGIPAARPAAPGAGTNGGQGSPVHRRGQG